MLPPLLMAGLLCPRLPRGAGWQLWQQWRLHSAALMATLLPAAAAARLRQRLRQMQQWPLLLLRQREVL
jgi:hypothetical protein